MTESQSEPVWTLERVAAERGDVAALAGLHTALRQATEDAVERQGPLRYDGAPAVHWSQGRSLLDACHPEDVVPALRSVVTAAADAMATFAPDTLLALGGIGRRLAAPNFDWEDRVRRRLEPVADDVVPDAALFRFLFLRAQVALARTLVRSVGPPHPDRWLPARCPFCGIPAAAEIGVSGSSRLRVCVGCTAQWRTADRSCGGCGADGHAEDQVYAAKEIGPVTLEACGGCDTVVKVFPSDAVVGGDVLPLEILTVPLDMATMVEAGRTRHETALATLFPPA